MDLILRRTQKTKWGVFSELLGPGFCLACAEHSYDGEPKLPDGVYTCVFGSHVLHSGPIQTYEITKVPGHSGILFHQGNMPQNDSDGCVLVGLQRQGMMVIDSRKALERLLALEGEADFQLTVVSDQVLA